MSLDVTQDITTEPWPELDGLTVERSGTITKIGLLPDGTTNGQPSLVLVVTLPDGGTVIGQTSWRLFARSFYALLASPAAQLALHPRGAE